MMILPSVPMYYYLLAFCVSVFLGIFLYRWTIDQKLKGLGWRAPRIKLKLLFGLDFLIRGILAVRNNRILELWQWIFEHTGAAATGYTSEVNLLVDARAIFTCDIENIKAILTTQFNDYGKGVSFHRDWKDFLGDSIFTTDGQQWHDSRQLIRPMFIRERVVDLDIFEEHVSELVSLLGPGDGRVIRLDKLLSRYTLDAATHFLLGRSVGSLGNAETEFATAFNEVQRVQAIIARANPVQDFVPKKSFRKGLKVMEAFVEPYVSDALAMSKDELENKIQKSESFIHALARFTRDRKVIRDQLVAVLLAGRDTTAATLSWIFLELARNPKVAAKLRKEIFNQIGEQGRKPTYTDIKEMKYLTYVVNETLRLYPAVPYNVRHSLVDTTLPHGSGPDGLSPVGILKNTPVGYSPLLMQRRRDLYPPISEDFPYDPLVWVPERWATWTPQPWQFIPFNGGPRICIGQQFAMMEMGYTVARVLMEFESLVNYGSGETLLRTDILLTPANGVKVGFRRRTQTLDHLNSEGNT